MELIMNMIKKYLKEKFEIGKSMEKASYLFIKLNLFYFKKDLFMDIVVKNNMKDNFSMVNIQGMEYYLDMVIK